jgi:flavodoxin
MNIAIVYHSTTGKTAEAAKAMGKTFQDQGHQVQVQSVFDADPAEVCNADLICVGSWVHGLFIIRQHPTPEAMYFVNKMENLEGKRVLVFCTYLLAAGSTLAQMAEVLEDKGAEVVGRFKYRGPEPNKEFTAFAASIV